MLSAILRITEGLPAALASTHWVPVAPYPRVVITKNVFKRPRCPLMGGGGVKSPRIENHWVKDNRFAQRETSLTSICILTQ